jgi:hypothetical protein
MRAIELLEDQYEPVALGDDVNASIMLAAKYMRLHCQPWINTVGLKHIVYRGTKTTNPIYVRAVRSDRTPRDSIQPMHTLFDELITMAGGVANRTNSAFVTSDLSIANIYGNPRIAIPAGNFNYTWSPIWKDWYAHISNNRLNLAPLMRKKVAEELKELYSNIFRYDDPVSKKANDKFMKRIYSIKSYDPALVSKAILADEGILEAIKTGSELMIKCDAILYIDSDLYKRVLEQYNEQNA